jgi:hypothetical protein
VVKLIWQTAHKKDLHQGIQACAMVRHARVLDGTEQSLVPHGEGSRVLGIMNAGPKALAESLL